METGTHWELEGAKGTVRKLSSVRDEVSILFSKYMDLRAAMSIWTIPEVQILLKGAKFGIFWGV